MVCFHTHSVAVELKKPGGPLAAKRTIYGSHTWSGGTIYGSKICRRWSGGTTYGGGPTAAWQFMHLQTECVYVMDVNVMTKICDGNFYYDRKKMITVTVSDQYHNYVIIYYSALTADSFTVWHNHRWISPVRKSLDFNGKLNCCLLFDYMM